MTNSTKWRKMTYWLRNNFPANKPISVACRKRKTAKKTLCGYCDYVNRRYEIYVDRKQVFALQVDTLIHEWAHAITWAGNDEDDHGEEWGLAYAKIYRAFLVWNFGRPGEAVEDG